MVWTPITTTANKDRNLADDDGELITDEFGEQIVVESNNFWQPIS